MSRGDRSGGMSPPYANPANVAPDAVRLFVRDDVREVTFKDFRSIAERRGYTVESLVDLFRGKIEEPREFFNRVMTGKGGKADVGDTVIPFKSVLAQFREWHSFEGHRRFCACECGNPVFGAKKWATPACRKRAQRKGHGHVI